MPSVSEIWVAFGADLSEFRRQTREANAIAGVTAAKITDAFNKAKINVKSLGAVSRELNTLKGRAGELRAALVNAEPRSQAYGKLAGELKAVEGRMRTLSPVAAQLKDRMEEVAVSMGRVGDTMLRSGAVMAAAFTAAGIGAVKAWEPVDEGIDRIIIGTGATGKALESLTTSFANVGKGAVQGLGEVGTVIADIHTRTGMMGKPLEDFASAVLNASRLTKEEAGGMSAAVTQAMNSWSIATTEATGTLDRLFVVAQATGIPVAKLAQEIAANGPALRGMGFAFDEAAALLGKFERAGVETQAVIAGMKMGLAKMGKAGVADPIAAFKALVAQIKETKTQAEATTLAAKMFGSRGAVVMAAAIREGRLEVDDLVASLKVAPGAIQRTANATDDLKESWGRLVNTGQLILAPVGGAAVDALGKQVDGLRARLQGLKDSGQLDPLLSSLGRLAERAATALGKLANALLSLAEAFARLPAPVQDAIAGLVAIAPILLIAGGAALKLASSIATLGIGISLMGGWPAVVAKVGGAFRGLVAAVTGPVGIIIGSLALVGVALGTYYKNNEQARSRVAATWGRMKSAAAAVVSDIRKSWDTGGASLRESTSRIWTAIANTIGAIADGVMQTVDTWVAAFKVLWDLWGDDLVAGTSRAWGYIADVVEGALTVVSDIMAVGTALMAGDWAKAWDSMADAAVAALYGILSPVRVIVGGVAASIHQGVAAAIGGLADLVAKVPGAEALAGALRNAADAALNMAMATYDFALAPPPKSKRAQEEVAKAQKDRGKAEAKAKAQPYAPPAGAPAGAAGGAGKTGKGEKPEARPVEPPSPAILAQTQGLLHQQNERRRAQLAAGNIDEETKARLDGEIAVASAEYANARAVYNLKKSQAEALSAKMLDAQRTTMARAQAEELTRLETTHKKAMDNQQAETEAALAGIARRRKAEDEALAYVGSVRALLQQRFATTGDVLSAAIQRGGQALAEIVGGGVGDLIKAEADLQALAASEVSRMAAVESEGAQTIAEAVKDKARELGKNPTKYLEELNAQFKDRAAPDWFATLQTNLQALREQVTGDVWKQRVELQTDKFKAQLTAARDALISGVQGLTGNSDQWRAGFARGVEEGYQKALAGLDKGIPGVLEALKQPTGLGGNLPAQQGAAAYGAAVNNTPFAGVLPAAPPVAPNPAPQGIPADVAALLGLAAAPPAAAAPAVGPLSVTVDTGALVAVTQGVAAGIDALGVTLTAILGGVVACYNALIAAPFGMPQVAPPAPAVNVAVTVGGAAPAQGAPAPGQLPAQAAPAATPAAPPAPTMPGEVQVFGNPDAVDAARVNAELAAGMRPAGVPAEIPNKPPAPQKPVPITGAPGEPVVVEAVTPPPTEVPVNAPAPVDVAANAPGTIPAPEVTAPGVVPAPLLTAPGAIPAPAVTPPGAIPAPETTPAEGPPVFPEDVQAVRIEAVAPEVTTPPPVNVTANGPAPVNVEAVGPAPVAIETIAPDAVPAPAVTPPGAIPAPELLPGEVPILPDVAAPIVAAPAPVNVEALPPPPVALPLPLAPPSLPAVGGAPLATATVPVAGGAATAPPAPATPLAPPVVTWERFMDAIRGGLAELTKAAEAFRGAASIAVAGPQFAPAGFTPPRTAAPRVHGLSGADFAARVAPPVLTPPATPGVLPAGVGLGTETRVVIEIEPSPLFEVKMRKTVLDVGREQAARGSMGATGAGK